MNNPIRVKFLSHVSEKNWLHQFPDNVPLMNNCIFLFDKDENNYDWLVVYEDLPRTTGGKFSFATESLGCPQKNTILVTQEPAPVKYYGKAFTEQFGYVLTSQPDNALPHIKRLYSQPALQWYYGIGDNHVIPYTEIQNDKSRNKTKTLSVVWSNKKQWHTLHHQRFRFLNFAKKQINQLDVFGKQHRPLDDKADALDEYKYHIAIENHVGNHYWTEKIADSFLGTSLPFYYGCPNLEEYFPENSFIRIDIFQPQRSIEIIKTAIANQEYEKRIEALKEAKTLLMQRYNLFVVLSEFISTNKSDIGSTEKNAEIRSRKSANQKNSGTLLNYLIKKYINRIYYIFRTFYFRKPLI